MSISFEVPKPGEYDLCLQEAPVELFSIDKFPLNRLKELRNITGVKEFCMQEQR